MYRYRGENENIIKISARNRESAKMLPASLVASPRAIVARASREAHRYFRKEPEGVNRAII